MPIAGSREPTATPGITNAPAGIDAPMISRSVITTNITIVYNVASRRRRLQAGPTDAELEELYKNTAAFFNETLAANLTASYGYYNLIPIQFDDQPATGGWWTNMVADTLFDNDPPPTDLVVAAIQDANFERFILNFVIPSGPYFRNTVGLDLAAGAVLKDEKLQGPAPPGAATVAPAPDAVPGATPIAPDVAPLVDANAPSALPGPTVSPTQG